MMTMMTMRKTFACIIEAEVDTQPGELTSKDWGSKRGMFYDTDHVDPDWGEDEEADREAEEEGKEV